MWETWVQSLSQEDPLEKGMATHSNILAWRIPCTEEPGGTQSMGLQSQTGLSDWHFHFSPWKAQYYLQPLASKDWHWLSRQELLAGGGRGGERRQSWETVSSRWQTASCSLTHTWHRWSPHSCLWKSATWKSMWGWLTYSSITFRSLYSFLLLSPVWLCRVPPVRGSVHPSLLFEAGNQPRTIFPFHMQFPSLEPFFLHHLHYWDALAVSFYPSSLPPLSVAEGKSLAVCLSCALLRFLGQVGLLDGDSCFSRRPVIKEGILFLTKQSYSLLLKPNQTNDQPLQNCEFYLSGKVLGAQSCPTVCDPMDCSPPGSSVHGILQAKIWEWVAIPFSRGSFQPRD